MSTLPISSPKTDLHSPLVFDVECYHNYFLVLFRSVETGAPVLRFQISPNRKLNRGGLLNILNTSQLVGFNCHNYDVPMLQAALKGYGTEQLKRCSDELIVYGVRPYDFARNHDLSRPSWNVVDLIQVAPLKGSLKLYAGRLHCPKMQDLPYAPDHTVTAETAEEIFHYCCNDLENTALLYQELRGQIKLREDLSKKYGQDLRSKSDPQVAEAIIVNEIARRTGSIPVRPEGLEGRAYKYPVPDFISYELPQLRSMLDVISNADFVVGENGAINLPEQLKDTQLRINDGVYTIGIGGLHSNEKRAAHVADEFTYLIDRDVTSYYPAIILGLKLYPEHLGPIFLEIYQDIVNQRIAAKRAGDKMTAESLKIAVNGSFGKFGNRWSKLYAPDLLIRTTLTGQLSLLMLIERIEALGIPVVSANTDGVVIKCPAIAETNLLGAIKEWETVTGFQTEETRYSALYSKDVNNYIALKQGGGAKLKGLYANPWEKEGPNVFKLQKNPDTTIVTEAVIAMLESGTPIRDTLHASRDIRKFITVRTVTGGAVSSAEPVGKAIRWYYATDSCGKVMNYAKSGNKVPKTEGAKPLMELPDEFPHDVNYDRYEAEALAVLNAIGFTQGKLF